MTDQMQMDRDDFKTLLDAVDAWVLEENGHFMLTALMEAMATRDRAQAVKIVEVAQAKSRASAELRQEQAIMLKAKILLLRDRLTAEAAIQEAIKK